VVPASEPPPVVPASELPPEPPSAPVTVPASLLDGFPASEPPLPTPPSLAGVGKLVPHAIASAMSKMKGRIGTSPREGKRGHPVDGSESDGGSWKIEVRRS